MTEIELATQRQLVMNLMAELKKAKDAARMVREAFEATETTSYERRVLEMEAQLAEEVAKVCKDYYTKTWVEALNQVGVPADFVLRRVENILFSKDIWEVPVTLPPLVVDPILHLEQLSIPQALPPDVEVLTGAWKDKEV